MRELFPDFWVPDNDTTGWMEKHPLVDGVPSYSYDQIVQSISACSNNLDIAVDVGAHLGLWAVRLAKVFRKVIAIEPIPTNFQCLRKNVSKFDNVEVMGIALGESVGVLGMRDYRGGRSVGWRACEDNPEIHVHCSTLEDIIQKERKVDFIKVDVDGHDYEVLLGAEKILIRDRPVVVIEEKLDEEQKASTFLKDLGMICIQSWKNDRLFVWG